MPRPLVLTDHLRELPVGQPLEIGAARTATQALTPGQIVGGANVSVAWDNGVLTISSTGSGGGQAESVMERMARLGAATHTESALTLAGAGPGQADSGVHIAPEVVVARVTPDLDGLSDVTAGADFAWIMTTGGEGANKHAFTVTGADAGEWAGAWRTYGNWRGRWVYRHRDDPARLCYFDPEAEAWTFAHWPADSVFPGYPAVWNARAARTFVAVTAPDAQEPRATGYQTPGGASPDFALDFNFIPLTGDEVTVANAADYGLDGVWVAYSHPYYGDRCNGMRLYRRRDGGEGCIYFESYWGAWVLTRWGYDPGDGYPQLVSSGDYATDPNHEYLAPKSSGYYDWDWGEPRDITVTVTG